MKGRAHIMKERFEKLVNEIESIRALAHEEHVKGFFESDFVLYDVSEFLAWKQGIYLELENINKDKFIENTISILDKFDGYSDRRHFDELVGALKAILDNVDYYYSEESAYIAKKERKKIVFISHATVDKCYVKYFVELLEDLGLNEEEIICSSIPPYCVPLGGKVYEWLVEKFQSCELHVMFMLSENYYKSVACLNEMGAAWALKQKWTGILLPGFEFGDIAGCIDSTQVSIKLDDKDKETLNFRLGELKEQLTEEFELREMTSTVWERKRGDFLAKIEMEIHKTDEEAEGIIEKIVLDNIANGSERKTINMDSCIMLVYVAESLTKQILVSSSFEGKTISVDKIVFTKKNDPRIVARWTAAISELENQGYIKMINENIFEVTYRGYVFSDQIKEELRIDVSHGFEEYLVD